MMYFPIAYHEPLFRPPSEARSLILQVTLGCSNNECAFCEMYKTKKFTVRKFEEIKAEMKQVAQLQVPIQKVFLADGDAFVLSPKRLIQICNEIKVNFSTVRRISAYALPSNINKKSVEELKQLKAAGLELLYVGIESGDDTVLENVSKGETYQSTKEAMLKLKQAGIKASVMVLIGLGGKNLTHQHALNSAKVLNETQPEFASTLVLSFPYGVEKYKEEYQGEFIELSKREVLEELQLFIENLELEDTVFRCDHASNYLVLKGRLGKDKEQLLNQVKAALNNQENLRPEWMRGL